jgi:hypothetical protein
VANLVARRIHRELVLEGGEGELLDADPELDVPRALLERFGGDERERLTALMRFLTPLSAPADYVADRRR